MTDDDASVVLHVRFTSLSLVLASVAAAALLLALVVAAFCGGVVRGARRAAGPRLQFERIN